MKGLSTFVESDFSPSGRLIISTGTMTPPGWGTSVMAAEWNGDTTDWIELDSCEYADEQGSIIGHGIMVAKWERSASI